MSTHRSKIPSPHDGFERSGQSRNSNPESFIVGHTLPIGKILSRKTSLFRGNTRVNFHTLRATVALNFSYLTNWDNRNASPNDVGLDQAKFTGRSECMHDLYELLQKNSLGVCQDVRQESHFIVAMPRALFMDLDVSTNGDSVYWAAWYNKLTLKSKLPVDLHLKYPPLKGDTRISPETLVSAAMTPPMHPITRATPPAPVTKPSQPPPG